MKKKFIFVSALISCLSASAEDVVVLRSGEIIKGKVVEITADAIKYRRSDNLEGPLYVTLKANVLSVAYGNGTQETFSVAKPIGQDPDPSDQTIVSDNYYDSNFRPEIRALFDPHVGHVDGGGGMEFVLGIQVGERIKMGPGVGLQWHNFYDDDVYTFGVPVFYQVRYDLTQSLVTPYLLGQVGYTLGHGEYCEEWIYNDGNGGCYWASRNDDFNLGPFVQCGIGLAGKLRRGRLFMDLSYKYQLWDSSCFSGPSLISLSVGYVWIPRK